MENPCNNCPIANCSDDKSKCEDYTIYKRFSSEIDLDEGLKIFYDEFEKDEGIPLSTEYHYISIRLINSLKKNRNKSLI